MTDILACIPVDRSGLPQGPELDAIVITDLYTLRNCVVGDCAVWVGPRQMETYNANPAGFEIMCYSHAIAVQTLLHGPIDLESDVVELGGGHPVEGRARIT